MDFTSNEEHSLTTQESIIESISSEELSNNESENDSIMYEKTLDMTYTFKGDEKDKPGFAEGIITITPLENTLNLGYYVVYLANEDGLLEGYDEFASIKSTGKTVSFEVKDGIYLPSEATKLVVFESTMHFFDDLPDLKFASDIIDITKDNTVDLGTLKYKFAAASDVHMNYEDYSRGAYQKWEKALDFFYDNNAECVIVTGDMTGDENLDYEYQKYVSIINDSNYDFNNVYECIGNHGNTPDTISLLNKYTKGNNQIHPFDNSPYYHVLIENEYRDNLFIFMAQELKAPGDSAAYDNFSKAQIDWVESLLTQYGNTNTNIFLIEHSPFLNYGAGDRHPGGYTGLVTFKQSYTQTMRLKSLLQTYKDVIVLSGHTHLTYYDNENFSDEDNDFCRTVHISSTCQPNSYNQGDTFTRNTDGRYEVTTTYGSEASLVEIYENYIIFKGYNLVTKKLIPAACIIMPIKAYEKIQKDEQGNIYDLLKGSGTINDPYQISNANEFNELTKAFNASLSTDEVEMFGYGKYFIQTADIDMSEVSDYIGTYANGNGKCFFAGNYNGNGHTLTVNIQADGQRSIFPYCYGVISNLIVKGSIKSTTSAQIVRTLYGSIINCIFEVDMTSSLANGICYSNYGFVYNVYTTGLLDGEKVNPISSNDSSTDYYNVFYYRVKPSGLTISDGYGKQSNDLNYIANCFNDTEYSNYNIAISKLKGVNMCLCYVKDNTLKLESN